MASSSWTVRNTFVHLSDEDLVEESMADTQPTILRSKTAPTAFPAAADALHSGDDTETPDLSDQSSSLASDVEWQSEENLVKIKSSPGSAQVQDSAGPRKCTGSDVRRRVSWAPEVSQDSESSGSAGESAEDQPCLPTVARRSRRSMTWHADGNLPAYVVPVGPCSPRVSKSSFTRKVDRSADSPARVEDLAVPMRSNRRAVTWHPAIVEPGTPPGLESLRREAKVDSSPAEASSQASPLASPQAPLQRVVTRDYFDEPSFTPVAEVPAQQVCSDEDGRRGVRFGSVEEVEVEVEPSNTSSNAANTNGFIMMQPWFFPQFVQWNMQAAAMHSAQMGAVAASATGMPFVAAAAASSAPPAEDTKADAVVPQHSRPWRVSASSRDSSSQQTTVMMRNVPNNYTRSGLMSLLDAQGFMNKYNFLYFPVDFETHAALGYAFINFVSPEDADKFHDVFEGFTKWSVASHKVCTVAWTQQEQGLDAHVQRYRNSPLMHELVPDEYRPVLLENGRRVPFPPPTKKIKAPRKGTKLMLV